ncbi:MAG TPA: NUDIX domain-containing protein [Fibrobacteria bacterium]|nr:NUDIX domain-containing protein [Fibrobacteria bacterium]
MDEASGTVPVSDPGGPREFAAALIVDRAGALLLLRRSPSTLRWPGKWGIAGGGVEAGETPEQGLRRELLEELGADIRLRILRGPDTLKAIGGYGGFIHLWHMLWEGGDIRLSAEHTEYAWVDRAAYAGLDIMPGVDEDLTHFGIWPERAKRPG